MMCYKDKTFCTFYNECKKGEKCHRALTKEELRQAIVWWGKDGVPISTFAHKPECFKKVEDE